MTICLDASVLVRCLTGEEGSAEALNWLESRGGEQIVSPSFLPFEFGSALRRKMIARQMTASQCAEAISLFGRLGIRYVWDPEVLETAFTISTALEQATVYDTAYLAVAEREKCELWTLDHRFAGAASQEYPCVKILS
jgi:predicted nucleic acid-binding protein